MKSLLIISVIILPGVLLTGCVSQTLTGADETSVDQAASPQTTVQSVAELKQRIMGCATRYVLANSLQDLRVDYLINSYSVNYVISDTEAIPYVQQCAGDRVGVSTHESGTVMISPKS